MSGAPRSDQGQVLTLNAEEYMKTVNGKLNLGVEGL